MENNKQEKGKKYVDTSVFHMFRRTEQSCLFSSYQLHFVGRVCLCAGGDTRFFAKRHVKSKHLHQFK